MTDFENTYYYQLAREQLNLNKKKRRKCLSKIKIENLLQKGENI